MKETFLVIADTEFFDAAKGGDAVALQHLYWYLGHPETWLFFVKWFVIIASISLIAWRLSRAKRYLLLFGVLAAFALFLALNVHIMKEAHDLFIEGRGHETGKLKVINWITTFLAYGFISGFVFERAAKYRDS